MATNIWIDRHPDTSWGDVADDDSGHGMGVVVEYAGAKGKPQWTKPKPLKWDYTQFGTPGAAQLINWLIRPTVPVL